MTEQYDPREDEPMISDTSLDDPALRDLVAELGALADRPTPPVGDELAALFAGATPLAAARSRRNKAAKTGLVGLVTAGILAGGVAAAAAANELPAPAQRIVSRVINGLTPLEIPNPDEQGPVEHQNDTNIDDNGDQPGQDVDQPDGKDPGPSDRSQGTDNGTHDQQGGQTDQQGTSGNVTNQQGTSQQGGSQQGTSGPSGEPSGGNQTGNDSADSGTGGTQQDNGGPEQN